MPCKRDIEKAILDKVFDELTDRRNTFTRTMDDTVQINGIVDNNKTKATRRDISKAIANELANRTRQSFNGHVKAYINDRSVYDPITVTFKVNPAYTDYEYNKATNNASFSPTVDYQLKSTEILSSEKADQVFRKGDKNNWSIDKILNELRIPKDQQELLKSFNTRNREQLLTNLLANYSYTIEINTAKTYNSVQRNGSEDYITQRGNKWVVRNSNIGDIELFDTEEEAKKFLGFDDESYTNTSHYSNLTVPGGTNYTENEIATPAIVPSIKGHAAFATDNGIGWFRSDEQTDKYSKQDDEALEMAQEEFGNIAANVGEGSKTRRILEVQSDLFQKGRNKQNLVNNIPMIETGNMITNEEDIPFGNEPIKEYKQNINSDRFKENQFLQLLNKDNNWVTFFVKSIIQDSVKKGYEKVLFPTGDTASKVEGHSTLEEFKKQKEDRIKELEEAESLLNKNKDLYKKSGNSFTVGFSTKVPLYLNTLDATGNATFEEAKQRKLKSVDDEISQLKQELKRIEKEGFGALRPIHNFYENIVTNILKKQGYKPQIITDEYGNKWNEVNLNDNHLNNISLNPIINNEEERDDVNNNVGPNTRDNSNDNIFAGVTEKYIRFRSQQLAYYRNQLDTLKEQKNAANIPKEKIESLNKKIREINLKVDGNKELGIKGLRDEISEMKGSEAKAIGYYMEKDLDTLDRLAKSNNLNDITEATRIINFLEGAGKFDNSEENPFFSTDEIFERDENGKLTTEYRIDDNTRKAFADWAAKAVGYKNKVNERSLELMEMNINDNPLVKNTYNRNLSREEITNSDNGLKDADWFSMYMLDPTHGLLSNNGIIPQVILSNLIQSVEKKEKWSRDMDEWLTNNEKAVKKELIKLGHDVGSLGITGIKGASFNLFKQVTKEGNETNNLVQRSSKEYSDAKSRALYSFKLAFDRGSGYKDYETRQKTFNTAFEKLKKWRRENSIIVDPSRLEDEDYKKELINLIGEKEFQGIVEEQEKNNANYESYRQGSIERLLVLENKNSYDELSDEGKNSIREWEASYDPKKGYEDFNSVKGNFLGDKKWNNYMTYNTFIPRKFVPEITANLKENKYEIKDTNVETGHWDKSYEKIQSNPVLADFYDKVKEFCEVLYENMPYDLQEKTNVYTLPGLMKTTAEIVNSNTETTSMLSRIGKAYQTIMDRFRTSFGVVKQSNVTYQAEDSKTGKSAKVNDSFLRDNSRAIENLRLIENTKFLQAFNSTRIGSPLESIKKSTSLLLSQLNPSSLIQLAQYLHTNVSLDNIEAGRIDAIKAKLDKTLDGKDYIVDIGKLINDFSVHSVVQSQSFDLPRLMRYFSEMTMAYAARREALPLNEILRKHYNRIEKPDTNNVSEIIWNKITGKTVKVGIRTGAIKQMDDWFDRVMLNNYSNKHVGVFSLKLPSTPDNEALIGKTIYTKEERKRYNELEELISKEKDEATKSKLIEARDRLGKTRTATAAVDNFLNWIRTLRLGYNLSSMATNFLEGVTSNMILGASDEYFDPKEVFYGYRVIKWSFAKNITFGYLEHPLAQKNRSLVEKFNVIIDNRNELQKSYSSKILNAANPYAGNQRVEYINQSPLMIAILRTMKIKDKEGNESSVWDAYESDGHLKKEFQTPENIENWEALEGEQYQIFKQKLEGLIILGHGNYHNLRGMMAKSSSIGKAGMMFKTWLPEAVYWRFGNTQDNIFLGKQSTKGRYKSYGAGTGLVHGAVVGAAMFGPIGAIIGGTVGMTAAGIGGTDSGVNFIKESIEATRLLIKKSLGIPINLIVGKQVLNLHQKQFFGKGDYFDYVGKSKDFTIQDSKNLQANIADIGMQLLWLGLILATKHFFWDDNDKPEDAERQAHNILMNKLMNLGSQASMYTNPVAFKANTIESIAVVDYLKQVGKEVDKVQNWFNGQDIIQSGSDAGKSALAIQTKKILLPGIFKDSKLGFGNNAEKVYPQESPYHKYFHSKEYTEKDENKRSRAAMRYELEQSDEFKDMDQLDEDEQKKKKKEMEKMIDDELPTPAQIKKQNGE